MRIAYRTATFHLSNSTISWYQPPALGVLSGAARIARRPVRIETWCVETPKTEQHRKHQHPEQGLVTRLLSVEEGLHREAQDLNAHVDPHQMAHQDLEGSAQEEKTKTDHTRQKQKIRTGVSWRGGDGGVLSQR